MRECVTIVLYHSLSGKGSNSNLEDDGRPTANSTNDTSISVEETNRIRAKLGLKPLETGDKNSSTETSSEKKDVHVPAGIALS